MAQTTCSIEGCDTPSYLLQVCRKHHERIKRWGDPHYTANRQQRTLIERVDSFVAIGEPDQCWPFEGYLNRDGYGEFGFKGKSYLGHRAMYMTHVGPIPDGLHLDHLCRNRKCCNPAHLEPVTNAENNRRSASVSSQNGRKTHCIHGHEFTPENTRITPEGARFCKQCGVDYQRTHSKTGRPKNKLSDEKVREVRRLLASGLTLTGVSVQSGVNSGTVYYIREGRYYRNVS